MVCFGHQSIRIVELRNDQPVTRNFARSLATDFDLAGKPSTFATPEKRDEGRG
jgi:hypothetical protein